MILMAREYALWKSSLRAYFILEDGTIERDIAILKDLAFLRAFSLYSVFLIGFIPIALQKVFRRLYVGFSALLLLFIPCLWYGFRITHVSAKMVDWMALFRSAFESVMIS